MINLGKGSEKEDSVDKEPEEEMKKSMADEPDKEEEKISSQKQKDGKENKCKHKRKRESNKQGMPETEAKDKDGISSKERKKWRLTALVCVLHLNYNVLSSLSICLSVSCAHKWV